MSAPTLTSAGLPPSVVNASRYLAPSGGDDAAAMQAAITALSGFGEIVMGPGTFLWNSAVPKLPAAATGIRIVGSGPGTVIKLSSGAPRALDFNRTADYQTFQNVELDHFTVDCNSIGGSHHVIVGNFVAGASQQRTSFDQINAHDINVINAPVDPTLATARRFAFSFDLSTLADNEATQLYATNLTFKRIRVNGAGVGIYVGGVNTNNTTTGTPNCWIDDIEIDDVYHDLGSVQSSNFASATVQIGGPGALVGTVLVNKVRGKNCGDVTIEIDQAENATVSNSTATDSYGYSFLTTNFRTAANVNGGGSDWSVNAQVVNWRNCRQYRKALVNFNGARAFVVTDIGGTGNTIGTVNFTHCSMKRSAADTNSTTLGEAFHLSGKVNKVGIYKCSGTVTNSRCASGSNTASMFVTDFDGSLQTVLVVRGLNLNVAGTIAGGTFSLYCAQIDQSSLSQYAYIDIDDIEFNVNVTTAGGAWGNQVGVALGRFSGMRAAGAIRGLKFPAFGSFSSAFGVLVGYNGTFAPAGFVIDHCDFQQLGDGKEILFDTSTPATANSAFFQVGDNIRWSNNSNVFGLTRSRAVATDYTMTVLDRIIAVRNTAAARTITLPLASVVVPREERHVIDESFAAATNNITITRAGADTFAGGATTKVINTNGGHLRFYSDGTVWYAVT